jgi:hypothetical protein
VRGEGAHTGQNYDGDSEGHVRHMHPGFAVPKYNFEASPNGGAEVRVLLIECIFDPTRRRPSGAGKRNI